MVKTTSPLMSMEARGSIAKFLTFSERKSGSQVRWQKKQKNIQNKYKQTDVRSLYRLIYAKWLSLTEDEKNTYRNIARRSKKPLSGWNYFVRICTADPYTMLGLVIYYTFNRTGFNTINDLSGNGLNASLLPVYPSNCPQPVDSSQKKLHNALSFDSVDDELEIDYNSKLDFTTEFSCSFLIYIKDFATNGPSIFFRGFTPVIIPYSISFKNSVKKFVVDTLIGAGDKSVFCPIETPLNQWVKCLITFKKPNVYFYIDGKKYGPVNFPYTLPINSADLYFGPTAFEDKGPFILDEFCLYNRELSETEALAIQRQL